MWVDECLEWHRIWSGFQFVYCMTQAKHTMTVTTASSVDTTSDGLTPGIEYKLNASVNALNALNLCIKFMH